VLLLTGVAGESYREGDAFPKGAKPTFVVRDFPEFMAGFDKMFPQAE